MIRHETSGRWKLGLVLAIMATLCWGVLPIALKAVLAVMDACTLTWYRFLVAGVILSFFVLRKVRFRAIRKQAASTLILFAVACVCLGGNYVLYLFGLDHLTPGTAQIVIQLAPVFLLLGGLLVYRERFTLLQWGGLAVLFFGMALFFNRRLGELLLGVTQSTEGVLFIIAAAAAWGIYGLAQKQLLHVLPSSVILLVIYIFGALVFFPVSTPGDLLGLDVTHLLLLAFCAVNTLFAYGCFAEALAHWEASRISAVLATTPLVTFCAVKAGAVLFPGFMEWDELNALSVAGGFLVVSGSIACALSRARPEKERKSVP
jgi:drug/metabolite transporter (DMT)-like permease